MPGFIFKVTWLCLCLLQVSWWYFLQAGLCRWHSTGTYTKGLQASRSSDAFISASSSYSLSLRSRQFPFMQEHRMPSCAVLCANKEKIYMHKNVDMAQGYTFTMFTCHMLTNTGTLLLKRSALACRGICTSKNSKRLSGQTCCTLVKQHEVLAQQYTCPPNCIHQGTFPFQPCTAERRFWCHQKCHAIRDNSLT